MRRAAISLKWESEAFYVEYLYHFSELIAVFKKNMLNKLCRIRYINHISFIITLWYNEIIVYNSRICCFKLCHLYVIQ